MIRQLIIAASFLGVGLLLGSGVVILQLWTRSSQAESRVAELSEELLAAEEDAQQEQAKIQQATFRASKMEAEIGGVERDRVAQSAEMDGVRTQLVQLQAQNDELNEVAERAVELSNQVAELKQQLDKAGLGQAMVKEPDKPGLVAVIQRQRSNKLSDEKLEGKLDEKLDDGGWTSVVTDAALVPFYQPAAPINYVPGVPYSVGYPAIALPQY